MAQYNISVSGNQLIIELIVTGGDFAPSIVSLKTPSIKLTTDRIKFFDSAVYNMALLFDQINEIDGVAPTDLEDAADKIIALIANFNGGGAAPIPLSGTIEGNPVTGDITYNDKLNISKVVFGDTEFVISANIEDNSEGSIVYRDTVSGDASGISFTLGSSSFFNNLLGISSGISVDNNGVSISCTNLSSEGLKATQDFTTNITDLAYTQKKYVDTQSQVSTATSGTVNIDSGRRDLVFIHDAGATISLTLNMPTSPKNNQKVAIMSVGGIVGLTLVTAIGTIVGTVADLSALTTVRFIWNSSQNKWYKIN